MILERKNRLNIEQIMTDAKNVLPDDLSSEEVAQMVMDILVMQQLNNAAIREICTKLEILDEEFRILYSHNPIHHIESRLKSMRSIAKKLLIKRQPLNARSAMDNLTDIAGVRVICHYVEEVYAISELLSKQDDISVLKRADYIKEPKANGYRSLHLVVSVPVFLSEQTRYIPVEVQIRTIGMDFWASLEHKLRYKAHVEVKDALSAELIECASEISAVDLKMQAIHNKLKG